MLIITNNVYAFKKKEGHFDVHWQAYKLVYVVMVIIHVQNNNAEKTLNKLI